MMGDEESSSSSCGAFGPVEDGEGGEIDRNLSEQLKELAGAVVPAEPVLVLEDDGNCYGSGFDANAFWLGSDNSAKNATREKELLELVGVSVDNEAGDENETLSKTKGESNDRPRRRKTWITPGANVDSDDEEYARWVREHENASGLFSPNSAPRKSTNTEPQSCSWRSFKGPAKDHTTDAGYSFETSSELRTITELVQELCGPERVQDDARTCEQLHTLTALIREAHSEPRNCEMILNTGILKCSLQVLRTSSSHRFVTASCLDFASCSVATARSSAAPAGCNEEHLLTTLEIARAAVSNMKCDHGVEAQVAGCKLLSQVWTWERIQSLDDERFHALDAVLHALSSTQRRDSRITEPRRSEQSGVVTGKMSRSERDFSHSFAALPDRGNQVDQGESIEAGNPIYATRPGKPEAYDPNDDVMSESTEQGSALENMELRVELLGAAFRAVGGLVRGHKLCQDRILQLHADVLHVMLDSAAGSRLSRWLPESEILYAPSVRSSALSALANLSFRNEGVQAYLGDVRAVERILVEIDSLTGIRAKQNTGYSQPASVAETSTALLQGQVRKELSALEQLQLTSQYVTVLRYLAFHKQNRARLSDAHAETHLIETMRWLNAFELPCRSEHEPQRSEIHAQLVESTKVNVCVALSNATYDVHEAKVRAVRSGGLRETARAMLESKLSLHVQHSGARALRNICDAIEPSVINDASNGTQSSCEAVVQALTAAVKSQLGADEDSMSEFERIEAHDQNRSTVASTDVHEHALAAFRNYVHARRMAALSEPLISTREQKTEKGKSRRRRVSQLKALQCAISFTEAVTMQNCANLALKTGVFCSNSTREQAENLLLELEPFLTGTCERKRSKSKVARVKSMPKTLRRMVSKAGNKMKGSRSYTTASNSTGYQEDIPRRKSALSGVSEATNVESETGAAVESNEPNRPPRSTCSQLSDESG